MKLADIRGERIALAASGGLDSCTVTRWLADQGVEVVGITADIGQPDEDDIADIGQRMLGLRGRGIGYSGSESGTGPGSDDHASRQCRL